MEPTTTDGGSPTLFVKESPRRFPTRHDWREFNSKTRIYFWPADETILQNLENRHSRPYQAYREMLPEVFEHLGFVVADPPKARWSQQAGCSCGCSPGFVLDRRLVRDGVPIDIHVHVS